MDRRVSKTKSAIRHAYFTIVKRGDTVTIAQIARIANIDRKTFYLHYDSIEDLIHEYVMEQVDGLVDLLIQNGYFEKPLDANIIFSVLEESVNQDPVIIKKLYKSAHGKIFWSEIVNIIVNISLDIYEDQINCSKEDFMIAMRFYANAIVATYQDYINSQHTDLKQHYVEIIHTIIHEGIHALVNE